MIGCEAEVDELASLLGYGVVEDIDPITTALAVFLAMSDWPPTLPMGNSVDEDFSVGALIVIRGATS
jgi:hypothetical protein